MKHLLHLILLLLSFQIFAQNQPPASVLAYAQAHPDGEATSKSIGTVSQGSLQSGRLFPFQGSNFRYFDTLSYVSGRAWVHERVRGATLDAYAALDTLLPGRMWGLMECSNEKGGKIWPHRTHQNGLSIDFMVPMQQNGAAFYGLDTLGLAHYLLEFDADSRYLGDTSVHADLDLVARHLLLLQKSAKAHRLKIAKVILKLEFKDELFATPHGKLLKNSGIYIASELTSLINGLHDNHYHVDFGLM
jgi:penicillin-insensitive murein endopeptidase